MQVDTHIDIDTTILSSIRQYPLIPIPLLTSVEFRTGTEYEVQNSSPLTTVDYSTLNTMSFQYYAMSSDRAVRRRPQSATTDDLCSSPSHQRTQTIHKAIRDGEYAALPDLVGSSPELLWRPNQSGWTAVHYAAAHFLPTEWWQWVLERAVQAESSEDSDENRFMTCRNALGQTVTDIFWKSYFDPLPWQSIQLKTRSTYLQMSIKTVLSNTVLQESARAWIARGRQRTGAGTTLDYTSLRLHTLPLHQQSAATAAVLRCVHFWTALDLLQRAAIHQSLGTTRQGQGENYTNITTTTSTTTATDVLRFCCRAGTCPRAVVDLILCLQSDAASRPCPVTGSLPLHLWANSHNNDHRQPNGLLEPLLRAHRVAATAPDAVSARLPLHAALASGKSWTAVQPLWELAPDILHLPDAITRLPAMALAAAAAQDSVEIRARQIAAGDKGLVSLWNLVPVATQQEARQKAVVELECEQLTTVYQVLQAFPQVLTSTAL